MDQSDNSDNDRKIFPTIEMCENYLIQNNDAILKEVMRQFCSKMADKLVINQCCCKMADKLVINQCCCKMADKLVKISEDYQSKNCQQSLFKNELNDCSTGQSGDRPSQKPSVKKEPSKSPCPLNNSLSCPKTSDSPSSSENSENPENPDSPVPTTSEKQQVDYLESLKTLVKIGRCIVSNLTAIVYQILPENDGIFSAFYLVDESLLKVRVQISNSHYTEEKYAGLANMEVGQVVSLQNVNYNENKYMIISSKHETEFEIDPDNVRAGELRKWFENGKNKIFETVGRTKM